MRVRRRFLMLVLCAFAAACTGGGTERQVSSDTGRGGGRDAPGVLVILGEQTKAGRTRVRIAGDWRLTTLDGEELGRGSGLDTELEFDGSRPLLARRELPRDGAVVVAREQGDLHVGKRRYPGRLRLARAVSGGYRVAIETDLETYVEGVIGGEIPAKFPTASQQVQAVIARTYALSNAPDALRGGSIVVRDSGLQDQEYAGISPVAAHRDIASRAATSTRGLVLIDGARPLRTWYHSTCGGHTCPAETVFPPLPQQPLPAAPLGGVPCTDCKESKYYTWSADLVGDEVAAALGMQPPLQALDIIETTSGGRATKVRVRAGNATKTLSANAARLGIGPSKLRSTLIDEIELSGGSVRITGQGWGHGVGLCQMGAKGMADRGSSFESVLRRYYPGAKLERVW